MNSLNQDIKDKVVIVEGRRFHCKGGFGCYSFTMGSAIHGQFENENCSTRISGHDVERLAPEEIELLEASAETKQAVQEAIETNDREDGVSPTCSPGSVS